MRELKKIEEPEKVINLCPYPHTQI